MTEAGQQRIPTHYEWIHPSWRDLVIDHLVADHVQRQRFLTHCGVQGAVLALSTGGGVEGERSLPLLKDPEDWTIFGRRLAELAETVDTKDLGVLLATLEAAIDASTPDREESTGPLLQEAMSKVLTSTRERWTHDASPILLRHLEHYYRLSVLVKPLPPGPPLDVTWNAYRLRQGSDSQEPRDRIHMALRWLELVTVLRVNEPRFLRQEQFPDRFHPVLEDVLDGIEEEAEDLAYLDSTDQFDEDGEEYEIDRIELLIQVLISLKRISAFEERISQVRSTLDEHKATRERRRERENERMADMLAEEEWGPYEEEEESEAFSIDDVFADL